MAEGRAMVALDSRWQQDKERLLGALRELSVALGGGRIEEARTEPHLQPTVFIPRRRGEDISWNDVVARRV
ncbi:MAG: hypothetical protein ACHQX4_06740 [Gemmatimonadales bacterium]